MLVAFNQFETLTKQLTHGTPARQGVAGTFEIICYFKDKDFNNGNYVTVTFKRPDGTKDTQNHAMTYDPSYVFHRTTNDDVNTAPFVEGMTYHVFKYSVQINDFTQYGTYEATITVHASGADSAKVFVGGLVKIPVQKSVNDGTTGINRTEYNDLINKILSISSECKVFVDSIENLTNYENGTYLILKSNGCVYEVVESVGGIKSAQLRFKLIEFGQDGTPIYYTKEQVDYIINGVDYIVGNH